VGERKGGDAGGGDVEQGEGAQDRVRSPWTMDRHASCWIPTCWSALARPENLPPGRTTGDARKFLRYLARQCHLQQIHFLWRPSLSDADDDMVLEVALAAGTQLIITHNARDFRGAEQFDIAVHSPREFLELLRATP
jgi:hypothetical protein